MWGKFLFFKKKIKMHFFLHEYNHIQYRNEILKKKVKKNCWLLWKRPPSWIENIQGER